MASVKQYARGFFVTGTDTGVGKTLIACAMLHAFRKHGLSAVGMKPVAAGCEPGPDGPRCEDVDLLRAASSVAAPQSLVNPYPLTAPLAPHIAAAQQGVEIELEPIRTAYAQLAQMAEIVIVEGVGGFRVPFNAHQDSADLAVALGLPVILVVGMRLGCLSHALLTQEAIQARGLCLAGWVANRIDVHMQAFDENLRALQERMDCPLLGVVPWQEAVQAEEVAALLDVKGPLI